MPTDRVERFISRSLPPLSNSNYLGYVLSIKGLIFMPKIVKVLLIIFFIVIGLFSLFFSFMIVGAGVSGSGCGTECLDSVSTMKTISFVSFGLALLSGLLPAKKSNDSK